ncbi:MAG: type II methionyl aminopeptidase [Asgard group archaeon]|nr:type II methionyl aminopeptidase [Asgard group archaeon]
MSKKVDSKKSTPAKKETKTVKKKKIVKKRKSSQPAEEEEQTPLEKYIEAGKISIEVKKLLRKMVKIGTKAIDICEAGEQKIKELGGDWAFPLNVSINNVAAHYSSPPGDDTVIKKGDVVKVDCGIHVDGYIADTAFTVSFHNDYNDLVKASEEATKAAMDLIRPGISTSRLGEEIEEVIKSYDYRPIRELSGHQLDKNLLHGPITIPNIKEAKEIKLEEGQAFAIETFASTGSGSVHQDESKCYIYQLIPVPVPLRLKSSKQVRKVLLAKYKEFPFTIRWLAKEVGEPTTRLALRDLADKGQIRKHPPLCDIDGSYVSQSEHTVYLTDDSRIITTLPNQ